MRLATICARAGSKRLPRKALLQVDGRSLFFRTVLQAHRSGCFDGIAVSTDSDDIMREAPIFADYGPALYVFIERPGELATDAVGKVAVIRHALLEAERPGPMSFDQIVDLDVTAPLRTLDDIRGFCAKLDTIQHGGLVSVTPSRRSPYFNQVELRPDGTAKLVRQLTGEEFIRSQDVPQTYDLNASMTGWTRKYLMEGADHPVSWNTHIYEMPPERSWDIDTEHDWRIVEFLMGGQKDVAA